MTEFFKAVLSQDHVRRVLARVLEHDRIAHGYLFAGPEGSGRFKMALEFARVLNCNLSPFESAQSDCQCDSCLKICKLQHPNLKLMFPLPAPTTKKAEEEGQLRYEEDRQIKAQDPYRALKISGSGLILVDQIRNLRNLMSLAQDRPGVRVVIMQPAERLNQSAANALLKLLEEPPEKCCLILITSSVRALLPTIVSRCQVQRFSPLGADIIAQSLIARFQVDPEQAEAVARLSDGNYTKALSLLEEGITERLDESLDFLRSTVTGHAEKVFVLTDSWARNYSRHEISERLNYVSIWIKDALIMKSLPASSSFDYLSITGYRKVVERISTLYSVEQLRKAWSIIEETRQSLNSNVMAAITLTALAVKIGRVFK